MDTSVKKVGRFEDLAERSVEPESRFYLWRSTGLPTSETLHYETV